MDYISSAQAAEKWSCSLREVQRLLAENRIPEAKRCGRVWLLPADCEKPADPRKAARQQAEASPYLPCTFLSSMIPMPKGNAGAVLDSLNEAEKRQYRAELAYLRGSFDEILAYAEAVPADESTYICACAVAMSAAISLGNYTAFTVWYSALERLKKDSGNTKTVLFAEAALATAHVSMLDAESLPQWLKDGDFSSFPHESRPWLVYLYTKYLQIEHKSEAIIAASQSALALLSNEDGFYNYDIYLRLMCAGAYKSADNSEQAEKYIIQALELAIPYGFYAPFSETVTAYGGLLEKCVYIYCPQYHATIFDNSKEIWKRWFEFHNRFAKDNITLLLTLREYELAQLLAGGCTYARAAKSMHLSVSAVNKLACKIYGKLLISGKAELKPFLL